MDFGPIRFVPGKKGGRYPYCHSLVLEGEEVWVVDPSSDKDYLGRLAREKQVTRVFLSHFHEDHQKYNYLFPEARFYGPAAEAEAFASLEGIFKHMGVEDPQFRKFWGEVLVRDFRFRPLTDLVPYHPGQRFQTGDILLEVIPAPGHTPGHSCFYFPRQDLLFLADVDLSPFGPWYGDRTSSLADYEATLEHLNNFQARTFVTAHEKGIFSEAEFRVHLPRFHQVIAAREIRLLETLRTPRTIPQLAASHFIYGKPKEPPFTYFHMECQMLEKHLDRLLGQGLVTLTSEGYVRT